MDIGSRRPCHLMVVMALMWVLFSPSPVATDGQGGYEIVPGLQWSEFAQEKVMITQVELRNEKSLVLDLLP